MSDNKVEAAEFKAALGRLLGGVTVVTTVCDGEIHGMTATSFISVSLEPPLVLVSVAKKARFHSYVSQSGRYGVSILSSAQEALSTHFAWKPVVDPVPWANAEGYVCPVLEGSLAWLDCVVVQVVDGGDHTLFLGQVERARSFDGGGLGYFRGKYAQVG